jgi:hypothetical protein
MKKPSNGAMTTTKRRWPRAILRVRPHMRYDVRHQVREPELTVLRAVRGTFITIAAHAESALGMSQT